MDMDGEETDQSKGAQKPPGGRAEEDRDAASNQDAETSRPDANRIVRHIMVIGFHHKHGYQVDYCYPPLAPQGPVLSTAQNPISLPASWKTLPLLCLPDGSHNYDSDTIYFTMPDIPSDPSANPTENGPIPSDNNQQQQQQQENSRPKATSNEGIKTIFGTACYRQIQVDKLLNKTDDMTRLSVQKSVCVLSTQPLFGLIRSKLEMITHAYFEELDFSKVRILKLTYDNLNSLLARDSVRDNAIYLGLSARNLVGQFGSNMLVLFKAMLLEKKILFYKSPVRDLCSTIMSMCSLFPGLLECNGLDRSTCDLQLSATLLEALKLSPALVDEDAAEQEIPNESRVFFSPSKEEVIIMQDLTSPTRDDLSNSRAHGEPAHRQQHDQSSTQQSNELERQTRSSREQVIDNQLQEDGNCCEPTGCLQSESKRRVGDDTGDDELVSSAPEETIVTDQHAHKLCHLRPEECGFPLQIFTRGSFCLPYLSISYLDLLSDTRVRSFVIGATNFLFKQRREMYDVIVDMEEDSIIINDPHLKRCLSLTIEDLRFMDYLSQHVKLEGGGAAVNGQPSSDYFDPINQDVTRWLGGDEWIRYHYKIYTLYLMKAAKTQSNLDAFNANFVQAWKLTTNNYRIWDSLGKWTTLDRLQSRHPFNSTTKGINFSDVKLKLSYAVNSSERGKLVNQTLNGIGKWSIWNNLVSAGSMAATTVSTLASSAAAQTNSMVAAATSASGPFQAATTAAASATGQRSASEPEAEEQEEEVSGANANAHNQQH